MNVKRMLNYAKGLSPPLDYPSSQMAPMEIQKVENLQFIQDRGLGAGRRGRAGRSTRSNRSEGRDGVIGGLRGGQGTYLNQIWGGQV